MLKKLSVIFMLMTTLAFSKAEKVTVSLDWTPNTNHTGIYVAKALGYFEEEGLDVKIVQPSNGSSEQLVATGRADYGVSYQENVTLARIEGLPLVSIAAIIQHNTSGFTSIKSKNITRPRDFEGKSYGGWGSPVEEATIKAIMEADKADFEKINVTVIGDMDFFQSQDHIDLAWVFEGWTNIEARLKGKELNYIPLIDYSKELDFYTPIIITSEKKIAKEKDEAKRFMKAVKKGYEYAISNPIKAGEVLLKEVPELNKELVIESQKYLAAKYQDDAEIWGIQDEKVWNRYQEWLYKNKIITKKTKMEKAFTNEFIK